MRKVGKQSFWISGCVHIPELISLASRIAKEARSVQLGEIDWEQTDSSGASPIPRARPQRR